MRVWGLAVFQRLCQPAVQNWLASPAQTCSFVRSGTRVPCMQTNLPVRLQHALDAVAGAIRGRPHGEAVLRLARSPPTKAVHWELLVVVVEPGTSSTRCVSTGV